MKRLSKIITAAIFLAGLREGVAQSFINLNFESATVSAPGTVSASNAFPGWTAVIAGISQSAILYNNATLGASSIAIQGIGGGFPVLQGSFSTMLIAGASPANEGLPGDSSISQTAMLPVNAATILFEAAISGNTTAGFVVTLNNQIITVSPVMTTANYTLYGGNVSAFAGQTASLTFTAVSDWPSGFEAVTLDAIQFSSSPIPEPTTLALAALGAVFLGFRRWKNVV